MNGYPFSLYQVNSPREDPIAAHEVTPEAAPRTTAAAATVVPPKPQPRTTVSRPATVGTLREAKAAAQQRVPITERVKEPVVPAREKQKRKTIAFGATVNVSQTVERDKDPHLARSEPRFATVPRTTTTATATTTPMASHLTRGGTGLGTTTTSRPAAPLARHNYSPLVGGVATAAAAAPTAPPAGDENRNPAAAAEGTEDKEQLRAALQKESARTARLEARLAELERRERAAATTVQEFQKQITNLVEVVSTLTRRVHDLKDSVQGGGGGTRRRSGGERGGGGGRRDRSSEDEDGRRPFRRLHLSGDEQDGRDDTRRRGGGGAGGGARHTTTPHRLLSDEETRRALERQLTSNPVLLRQLQDAVAEDAYERDYGAGACGAGERRAHTTNTRRTSFFDDHNEPRAAGGTRGGQRWKEDAHRGRAGTSSPTGGRGIGGAGAGGGGNRRRADITPSRRRVTERVTMERVHHFDDTDESEEARYESDEPQFTVYKTEYMEEDSPSVVQADRYGQAPARMHQQQLQHGRGGHRGGAPLITEVSDSEDSLERKRRELRERKEARESRGKMK